MRAAIVSDACRLQRFASKLAFSSAVAWQDRDARMRRPPTISRSGSARVLLVVFERALPGEPGWPGRCGSSHAERSVHRLVVVHHVFEGHGVRAGELARANEVRAGERGAVAGGVVRVRDGAVRSRDPPGLALGQLLVGHPGTLQHCVEGEAPCRVDGEHVVEEGDAFRGDGARPLVESVDGVREGRALLHRLDHSREAPVCARRGGARAGEEDGQGKST
mmetsp:Transcript_26195/g.76838  ORF Transcript_26195/g.76838 Transcript_26195/m.76838 type:complete len:220 (-) Transcript_26195:153-812(-)